MQLFTGFYFGTVEEQHHRHGEERSNLVMSKTQIIFPFKDYSDNITHSI